MAKLLGFRVLYYLLLLLLQVCFQVVATLFFLLPCNNSNNAGKRREKSLGKQAMQMTRATGTGQVDVFLGNRK